MAGTAAADVLNVRLSNANPSEDTVNLTTATWTGVPEYENCPSGKPQHPGRMLASTGVVAIG
jgi:cobalamin biosynthesis protein CobT